MRIAYFVHDLLDAAVTRRTQMLLAGGAEVVLIGFRREDGLPEIPGVEGIIDLGRTHDAQLMHRAISVAKAGLRSSDLKAAITGADLVIARNLEMLVIANWAVGYPADKPVLVYETLDIHRLMASSQVVSRLLRALERWLLRRCRLLIVSSPAFLRSYFEPLQRFKDRSLLLENRPLALDGAQAARLAPPQGPPWRIGLLGVIRCSRSLAILRRLASALPGKLEVAIAGKITCSTPEDFDRLLEEPGMTFSGLYQAADLERLYGEVHFVWAIDYYEEGFNSLWLLPNRIYEGGLHGVVPLVLADTETSRWVGERGVGVLLSDPEPELLDFFSNLTPTAYDDMRARSMAVPLSDLSMSRADCRELVGELAKVAAS